MSILSIIVPTVNRLDLLKVTINLLYRQYLELSLADRNDIELLVIDNSSKDGTKQFVEQYVLDKKITFHSFEDRLSITDSFSRCIRRSTGRHILIFGDDDIPLPGFLPHVLQLVRKGYDIIYFNRLVCDHQLELLESIEHPYQGLFETLYNKEEFIAKFTHGPGFISALVFSRSAWETGLPYRKSTHYGYDFLGPIFYGCKSNCYYVGYPMLVQRKGVQTWKGMWPKYWLVGMPNLLRDLEEDGLTNGALSKWRNEDINLVSYCATLFVAKAYGYRFNDTFWKEAAAHQKFANRLILNIFRYGVPIFLASFIYKNFINTKYQ